MTTKNVFDWKVGQKAKRKKTETVWSDERKTAYSKRMEQVWAHRKANL